VFYQNGLRNGTVFGMEHFTVPSYDALVLFYFACLLYYKESV